MAWLNEYEQHTLAELAERRRVLRYAKRVLREEPMYDVVTKHVDEQPYVSRAKRVYVRDLEPFICDTFAKLGYEEAAAPPFVLYREPAGPPRELYFNQIGEPLRMEVALPLR
jgi:hypothetical protein